MPPSPLPKIPFLYSLSLILLVLTGSVRAYVSYANDFVDPDFIVKGNFGNNTLAAQNTIIEWAKETAAGGPWAVTDKAVAAPTGNKHDYLSWAPYWWPDCSGVGNKTELTPEQIWTTCPYKSRDGQFNPDVRAVVNDIGRFENLSDAVFYNTLAWSLTKEPSFAESAGESEVRILR